MPKKKARRIKHIKGNRRGSSSKNQPKNGKRVAKPPDERLRRLRIPVPGGVRGVVIRGSREASRLGKYWAAVQKYLQTGDDSPLLRFEGRTFTDASGNRHLFPTDLKQLDRQASAGVLSFESMYAGGAR